MTRSRPHLRYKVVCVAAGDFCSFIDDAHGHRKHASDVSEDRGVSGTFEPKCRLDRCSHHLIEPERTVRHPAIVPEAKIPRSATSPGKQT